MSQQPVRLIKTLSMWQVVVMGLAYLTPMAVFDTFAIVGDITEGRVATAYLLALGGILLTAFSTRAEHAAQLMPVTLYCFMRSTSLTCLACR